MNEQWGVIGIPITRDGNILVLPGLSENEGKYERVLGYENELRAVVGGEFLGGAVHAEDASLALALLRETAEERGLIFSLKQLAMSSERYEVEQLRDGGLKTFLVACYLVNLTSEQENWLRTCGAIDYDDSANLRPRDTVIAQEFVHNYLVPAVVGVAV